MILELKFWLNLREYFDVLCSSTQEIVKVEVELVVSRKAIYEAWVYKWIVNHSFGAMSRDLFWLYFFSSTSIEINWLAWFGST